MPNETKKYFFKKLSERYGTFRKLGTSLSLFDIGEGAARIYIRYSKIHPRNRTFYGLRKEDILQLEGRAAAICFLWDGQENPLFVRYSDYEDVFHSVLPATDGQYKVQVFLQDEAAELYIANAGRFNVEGCFGWQRLDSLIDQSKLLEIPDLTHTQVQTLLGSIGAIKGYGIWIPRNDRLKLDWHITTQFEYDASLPHEFNEIENLLSEIDVIWIEKGAAKLRALFEVEHSTPIYSALLRFNDVRLVGSETNTRYSVVSNDERRGLFIRQLNRPTFKTSSLSDNCAFLKYSDVYAWHKQLIGENKNKS